MLRERRSFSRFHGMEQWYGPATRTPHKAMDKSIRPRSKPPWKTCRFNTFCIRAHLYQDRWPKRRHTGSALDLVNPSPTRFKSGLREQIKWLAATAGITDVEAYSIYSMAGSFRITQYADQVASAYSVIPAKAVHGMLPKAVFTPEMRDQIAARTRAGVWLAMFNPPRFRHHNPAILSTQVVFIFNTSKQRNVTCTTLTGDRWSQSCRPLQHASR